MDVCQSVCVCLSACLTVLADLPVLTEAMTRHMAVEWGQHGIRVMCVAPGPIEDTEGMRRLGQHFTCFKYYVNLQLCP